MSWLEDFQQLFAAELHDYRASVDLYRALCNNNWEKCGQRPVSYSWRAAGEFIAGLRNGLQLPIQDEQQCQNCQKQQSEHTVVEEEINHFLTNQPFISRRWLCYPDQSQTFIPGYQGAEDYIDFYCSGDEGQVAPWIAEKLASAGWQRTAL